MIVPDTSVWVAALRAPASIQAATLRGLLEADEVALPLPVHVELLAGAPAQTRRSLARGLSALPLMYPTDDTWKMIRRWVPQAADAGLHFGVSDLLIAAIATEAGALVWSLDRDFARMEDLDLVRLYEPPSRSEPAGAG